MGNILKFSDRATERVRFEALLRPHMARLFKLACRFTGNVPDAEDLIQDLLIKLYPRCVELEKLEQPAPWLARVMYRMWVDQRRRYHRSPVIFAEDLVQFAQADAAVNHVGAVSADCPARLYEREYSRRRLQQALYDLSDDHRTVVLMHDVEGYSLNEIGDILDCAVGTVKSRLHRARACLRQGLDDGTF
ncbi:MAG: RNA polymerase sigma-70 factor ECF subfamily [Gammaproteobacteria bacterium]|nr:MAG: RNA polymerase sigma-70 factor ECF subfamily [Gammaproteobacteria bacterium]TND04060.1 MAG: RNA polymerase sigma-70 factor, ECF subfamily [Gammaproteobacteria bacterium]